jgi:hypothetical protein
VDDLMSSHDLTVNDEFGWWLNRKYGNYGEVKVVHGKVHNYLGMSLDFSNSKKLTINMRADVANMIDEFSVDIG